MPRQIDKEPAWMLTLFLQTLIAGGREDANDDEERLVVARGMEPV